MTSPHAEPERTSSSSASGPADPAWIGSRKLRILKASLRVGLLGAVLWFVSRELTGVDLRETRETLLEVDSDWLLLGFAGALVAVAAMGLYDVASFPSTPQLSRPRRWSLGMLIFAWTNFLTLGPIGGPALRLYLYRKRGLEAGQVVRGLARSYAGMVGGLLAWLLASAAPLGMGWSGLIPRIVLAVLLAPLLSVLAGRIVQRFKPVGPFMPRTRIYMALGLIGALDWTAGLAVFVITGRALGIDLPLTDQVQIMFAGLTVGFISMMPGGLGPADAVWLKLLSDAGVPASAAAAHIVLFRLTLYIAPWLCSLVGLYIRFAGKTETLMRWQRRLLAGAIGLNALWLLASTATPAARERLRIVDRVVPVDAVELSHAVAVIAALLMVFLVRGILRGYRAAFTITGTLLFTSAVAHTVKGGDLEEALVSLGMLTLLLGAQRAFRRRGRVPIGWELTLAAALGSLAFFVLIGLATFEHERWRPELLTRVALYAESSRFLRGAVLVAFVGLVFLVRQAMLPRGAREFASEQEIDRAVRFIGTHSERAAPLIIAAGDKDVWFWKPDGEQGGERGAVVFQRRLGKIVVFSDPVVPDRDIDALLEDLHAFAQDQDAELVFYQITARFMQHLHDFGYTFFKLGEEAVVPVAGFSLQGGRAHQYRKTIRRVEGDGITFQVLHPPFSQETIDQARDVSDEWLKFKGIQEMQFSLGYFSPAYLQRFPLAVARDAGGRMVAFINILAARPSTPANMGAPPAPAPPGTATGEVTFDLMRYRPGIDALMDMMVLRALEWSHDQGYEFVNLGMSPLYDVGEYRRASIPERLARLLFEHGERIYNYRGVHAFKDKFRPVWEPRFMAYQRPWDWPAAVVAATSLIWAKTPADRRRVSVARVGA
jgi:phosphatidylglycerol lysyltransferase